MPVVCSYTHKLLALNLRRRDLLELNDEQLRSSLRFLGQSDRGPTLELMDRLYRHIWERQYDDNPTVH